MTRVKRISVFTIFLFVLSIRGICQDYNPIMTAVPFLQSSPDARATSLGNMGVATSADAASIFWNPAKYSFANNKSGVQFTHTPSYIGFVSGISQNYLSGYTTFNNKQTIGVSLNFKTYGALPVIDEHGNIYPDDESANELSFDVAYSRKLSDFFSMAVAFRYIYSNSIGNIDGYYAGNSFSADIAAYYEKPVDNGDFAFGCNISNIGTKMKYREVNDAFLPSNLRIGARRMYSIQNLHKITGSMELNKLLVPTPNRTGSYGIDSYTERSVLDGIITSFYDAPNGFVEELQEITYAIGFEYDYNDFFILRMGYVYNFPNKGNRQLLSFGTGFKYSMFSLDISYYVPISSLSVPQNLSIGIGYQF